MKSQCVRFMCVLGVIALLSHASGLLSSLAESHALAQQLDRSGPTSLARPQWKEGDSWQIETITAKLQGREEKAAGIAARIRWKFQVVASEQINQRDCWRINVECLAKGRIRPASAIWIEKETLFIRQFQTQLPVAGELRTVQETYEPDSAGPSPVIPPVNVLPVSLPAFLASSPKGEFKYTSQPSSVAGAKEVGETARFLHSVTQEVKPASAKSLSLVPQAVSKSLENTPAVEVHLGSGHQQVLQVWQANRPWPVYSDDGHTQSWLVVDGKDGDRTTN